MDERARDASLDAQAAPSPVSSHNEWDPLEEIIVGRLEGATIPSDHAIVSCNIPGLAARAQALASGFRYPQILVKPAQRELDGFIALLESLGVTVRRPEAVDYRQKFGAPGLVVARLLQFLPARQPARHRRGDHRDADGLALPLFRDAFLPRADQGLFQARRALDRGAEAAAFR